MKYFQSYLRAVLTATLVLALCVVGAGIFVFLQTQSSHFTALHPEIGDVLLAFVGLVMILACVFVTIWIFAALPVAVSLVLAKRFGFHSTRYFALGGLLAGLVLDPVFALSSVLFVATFGPAGDGHLTALIFDRAVAMILPFLAAGLAAGWVFGAHLNAVARKPSASAVLDLNP